MVQASPFDGYLEEQVSFRRTLQGPRVVNARSRSPLHMIRGVQKVEALQKEQLKRIDDERANFEEIQFLSERNRLGMGDSDELHTWQ